MPDIFKNQLQVLTSKKAVVIINDSSTENIQSRAWFLISAPTTAYPMILDQFDPSVK